MKTLIIDTSSEYCILALAEGDKALSHILFLHENRLSQSLLPEISALLLKTGLSLKEIDAIAVGVGPGSYTGTRIGVAVAKSLSYGLHIPLRGFCSLVTFLPAAQGHFASLLAAKSGLFFLVTGEKLQKRLKVHQACLITEAQMQKALPLADFVTARRREELDPNLKIHAFFPFHPDPENSICALQEPPQFPFETHTQLLYLHEPG